MQHGDRAREGELEHLLADERSRCTQYKQIYQTLKEDYTKLKEELIIIHQQLKDSIVQSNSVKSSNESYIKKLEQTIKDDQQTIREFERQVVSLNPDEQQEKIRTEEKKNYEEKLNQIQTEADDIQARYNQCHYETIIIKSKLEYIDKENERTVDLIKAQHLIEIDELKATIESLKNKSSNEPVKDFSIELRNAERELVQLNTKLKVLHGECDELRAQNEKLSLQIKNDAECHSKQVYEKITSIRALESEREILHMQKEVHRNEFSKLQQEKSRLSDEFQSHRQEHLTTKQLLEDCKRQYEIDTTNLKVELQQKQLEWESSKEQLERRAEKLSQDLHLQQLHSETSNRIASEKEENFRKYLTIVKQQSHEKCNELEQSRKSSVMQLKEMEIVNNEEIANLKRKLEHSSSELSLQIVRSAELEKKNLILKNKCDEGLSKHDQVYAEIKKQNSAFHDEIQLLKERINVLSSANVTYSDPRIVSSEESLVPRKTNQRGYDDEFKEVSQLRLTLEQQKYQYQQRIDCLENQMKEQQNMWLGEKQSMQQKIKQYGRLITKLRDRFENQNARLDEMEVQNELLKLNIPVDDHLTLKKELSDLQRKHEEFHQVMLSMIHLAPDLESVSPNLEIGAHTFPKTLPPSLQPFQEFDNEINKPEASLRHDTIDKSIAGTKRIVGTRRRPSRSKKASSRRMANYSSTSDLENI